MKNKRQKELLPFGIIAAAAKGDVEAMGRILSHYDSYIAKLSTRTIKDKDGNIHTYIDSELSNRLKSRLIMRTLAFRVD